MLLAANPVTYEVGLLAEARASVDGAADFQFDPALSAAVPVGSGSFTASYTPRILVLEPRSRGPASLLNRGRLFGDWRMGKRERGFVSEDIAYGLEVFSLLAAAAEGRQLLDLQSFDRLLTQTQLPPLRIFSESTTLGYEQRINRRLRMLVTATYAVSGGADAAARALLPVQHGPSTHLGLNWSVHSRNTLTAFLAATAAYFSTGRRAYLVDTSAGWAHRFSDNTSLAVALGVGLGSETGEGATRGFLALPYLDARWRREPMAAGRSRSSGTSSDRSSTGSSSDRSSGTGLGATLHVRVAPVIDPLTGLVSERGDGVAGVDYHPSMKLRLAATGGGGLALSGSLRGRTIGLAGLSASYELSRYVLVSGGGRVAHYQQITEWVGFVALKLSYGEHNLTNSATETNSATDQALTGW
jgi:hypothetical protein